MSWLQKVLKVDGRLDRDNVYFKICHSMKNIEHLFSLQDYYKTGVVRCPPSVTVNELREACDYMLIPFDAQTIKCQNLSMSYHHTL